MNEILQGDVLEKLKELPSESVDCCITSPPYWGLRDYGVDGQIGLEKTPEEYVAKMVAVFAEVKRVLKKEGTLWLNLGDSYSGSMSTDTSVKNPNSISAGGGGQTTGYRKEARGVVKGLKPKDLVGIPWRVAFALQADGWYLRQDIIWSKPNPMPESVTDRCTKSHEYIFLLAKSQKYYYDSEAIREDAVEVYSEKRAKRPQTSHGKEPTPSGNSNNLTYGKLSPDNKRNKRSVWTVTTKPFSEAHFATFPEDLIVPMIKAGCPEGGVVLDPFMGAGTTAWVAKKLRRNWIGVELNPAYIKIANERMAQEILI